MEPSTTSALYDPADIFPDLKRARARAQEGDVTGALQTVAMQRRRSETDHAIALGVLARVPGLDDALETHLRRAPRDLEARLLRLHRAVLDPDAYPAVDQALVQMCAEDPHDATPWYLRILTADERRVPAQEAFRRYERLSRVELHHFAAQRALLHCLRPAAGGSWHDGITLATRVAADAADGSPEHSLLAAAHLGRWHDLTDGRSTDDLCGPELVAQVEAAADRFLAAPCTSAYAGVVAHTELAVYFGLAGRPGRAVAHFRALGAALARGPWEAAVRHHERLTTLRDEALASGGPA
ncbi:hypothetical protein JQN72_05615 [Phycicoccus sp. CSK15P-2]|uniref:hypothetical protein n=1 Tax=Phycicoccus sp. CSK15P-2 TaxID=2807627 RepID=UPI0019504D34|nr:hypothetical protein [Phycicoccus sp. CSK15P-2]MBM6403717.1 hypothetical protein [Phycicoccus sp. CSK15P-2]